MEKKELNLVEILRDKPKDTPVWSPIFGEGLLKEICDDCILVETRKKSEWHFAVNGHTYSYPDAGELMLFPSEYMRDWEKYQWKKGDILYTSDARMYAMFDGWVGKDYTEFNTTYNYYDAPDEYFGAEEVCDTKSFEKINDATAKIVIGRLEKHFNGKYNPETMKIETLEPEFKPFDKVLVRGTKIHKWAINLFSHYNEDKHEQLYVCIDGVDYPYCIPYEGNEELLGTNMNQTNRKEKR